MSGLKVASYRDIQAERRRAEAREMAQIMRALQKLDRLQMILSNLDEAPASSRETIRARLEDAGTPISETERKRIIGDLGRDAERFEQAIRVAKNERIRLVLTARSLMDTAEGKSRQVLENAAREAGGAGREAFQRLRAEVENVVTRKILNTELRTVDSPLSPEARAIADSLMSSSSARPVLPAAISTATGRIDRLLKTLSDLGEAGEGLLEKAGRLFEQAGAPDFQLKLDSLCLEAATALEAEHDRCDAEQEVEEALDMLLLLNDARSAALTARLQATGNESAEERRSLGRDAKAHAGALIARADGEKARAAMLNGLRELGYEVHIQGNDWSAGERITVSRPEEPNYDVQLAALPDGKIQAKVRAFLHQGRSQSSNPRDVEVEQQWCSDLHGLHAKFQHEGLGATLEFDQAAGHAPTTLIERPAMRGSGSGRVEHRERRSDG